MRIPETLLLIGPNRRSEQTVIEQQLIPDGDEPAALAHQGDAVQRAMRQILPQKLLTAVDRVGVDADDSGPLGMLARLYNGLALALQRQAGHRVSACGFSPDSAGLGVWAWFEYEHDGVGQRAAELAVRLIRAGLARVSSAISDSESEEELATAIDAFETHAAAFVLPRDSEAIVRAAARLDLPCFKLERDPYPGLEGDFRIRANGLLMIGHARHKQILDGTFCVSRCARIQPLVRDREALRRMLAAWNVPLPRRAPGADNCAMTKRALRAAEAIGYPVVVRPGVRTRGAGISTRLDSPEQVRAAVDKARTCAPAVVVEAAVPGASHRLLLAGGKPVGVLVDRKELPEDRVHHETLQLGCRIARELDAGLVAVDIVTPDIGQPLAATGGAVVDVDLAPELDALLEAGSGLYDKCAEGLLHWMFPAGRAARIPIFAITGTNGKTTTCRMVSRILEQSGRHTGMVCSEGLYFGECFDRTRKEAGVGAHHRIFEREDVEAAVFEEYFGRIARLGFAYRWCDVAVCTNVTNDHLGRIGTHTLEEMAVLKRAVPQRARNAVVLNGDDLRCRAMVDACRADRICLVSTESSLEEEVAVLGARGSRCVVEKSNDGRDWLVLHDGDARIPLAAVKDIPASFAGTADFNVSNALHAAAACYFGGIAPETIGAGLRSFEMSFESTPGRLNRFDGLPYGVVMDYAHNADGFRQVAAFVDRQEVDGRRLVMFGFTGDRRDADIRDAARELAGHFDRYVCRNFLDIRDRQPHEIPELLKCGLLEAGVAEEQVEMVPDAVEAVHHTLDLARPGDLVLLLVGAAQMESVWAVLRERAGP